MCDGCVRRCGHCRQLRPIWTELSREAQAHDVKVASIEGPDNLIVQSRFGIDGYPSIFVVRDGQVWAYEGERSSRALLSFATSDYQSQAPMTGEGNAGDGERKGGWG